MATDYDALINEWETNGPAKVQEKISQLEAIKATSISAAMLSQVDSNILYLQTTPEDYISKVIQNYQRAKIESNVVYDEPNEE